MQQAQRGVERALIDVGGLRPEIGVRGCRDASTHEIAERGRDARYAADPADDLLRQIATVDRQPRHIRVASGSIPLTTNLSDGVGAPIRLHFRR